MGTYSQHRPQAHRPRSAPWWLPLLGLLAYAIVAAGVVWVAFTVLFAIAQYVPSGLR